MSTQHKQNSSVEMRRLNSRDKGFSDQLECLLSRNSEDVQSVQAVEDRVSEIIAQVRNSGDQALLSLTRELDGFNAASIEDIIVSPKRMQQALESIEAEQREALEFAAQRIMDYHQYQLTESWHYREDDGTVLGQKITPIKRVGVYVPGGKAAYPSSVLMNAIPAKIAGVEELVMVSPTPDGRLNNTVLAAAQIAGVDTVLRIGGAQAIAALAYGTETIQAVDKITGPGNIYVATAKKQVYGKVGIDMIAGPSEVLLIGDQSVDPDWVAIDLFAQAEHDEMAQAIFLTDSAEMATAVQDSINKRLPEMQRRSIIAKSLQNNGAIILVTDEQELIEIADRIAPEHLQLFTRNAEDLAQKISNAGAIFIGPYSAESLGDYCAGPNHVLPTSGTARFSSPLAVYDFQKRSSVIHMSVAGADRIGRKASIMARGESLQAHARSAELRYQAKD